MTKKPTSRISRLNALSISPSFHIEADGRGNRLSLLIFGVVGIKGFSESEILISTKRENITVIGEILEISVLEEKRVGICGKISGISFSLKKRGVKNEA